MILAIGKRSQRNSKGFTFIELILVSIIILVLAGLSTPIFKSPFQTFRLKDTCQTIVQLMRYLQAKSIAERKPCRINFDLAQGSFWLTEQADTSPAEFKRIKGRWAKIFKAPAGISIESQNSVVTFYPDGSSDKAEIKVSCGRGEAFLISAGRNINYVSIED